MTYAPKTKVMLCVNYTSIQEKNLKKKKTAV